MNYRRRMSTLALYVCMIVCVTTAGAELNRPRTPMTSEEVGQAVASELRARLPQAMPSQDSPLPVWDIDIPLAVPAASPHKLRVVSVCREPGAGLLRFKLACSRPGDCLPFLTYIRIATPVPASSCRIGEAVHTDSTVQPTVVHAGERVHAVLVAAGLRMGAAVTCLQNGVPGEQIRVRGEQGRIFEARVLGPGRVEALQR